MACRTSASRASRDPVVMAIPHSSSHVDTQEKNEQHKSVAETCENHSCERGEDAKMTNNIGNVQSLNRSSIGFQDEFENGKRFKENDVQRNCNAHVDRIDNNIDVADRLNTEDEVTKDPPQAAMTEKQTPLLSLSPCSETGDSEEVKEERKVQNHSLSDPHQNNDCADLPSKSTVPCFVYGICNSSNFKRRKKEAAKSQIRRQTSSLSLSFNEEKLPDEKHLSLSMFCNENGHQSASASPRKMAEHHSLRTRDENDSSGPLLTSKSNTVGINDETNAPHIGSADSRVPSELSLQVKALDLTTAQSKKDVPVSRADSRDHNTEHISYIAEFSEEAESSSAGDGEQVLGRSSKRGFLSITGLIQKRRTPMMKRYEMKDVEPETGGKDESHTEIHLTRESDLLKSATSHPMMKYYQTIQRDSQSVRLSEDDVSKLLGDPSREVKDDVSGSLEECSTDGGLDGMSNSEESGAGHSMVKYYQFMQGLPQTMGESEEEVLQDDGDMGNTTLEKKGISLVKHAETDTENDPSKRFKCKVCGRAFRHSQGLTAHKKIHSNERPFACQHCDLKFRVKQNLITHVRTHTGEKPHSCEICGRGFGQQSTLVRHLRSHTGEKPYTCEYCQRKFSQRHVMMNHVRIHTGEKPYSCEVCGKDFKEQHNLVRHVRTHTGEKPYTCDECGNKFTQKNHLMRHAKVHIPKKHTI